MTGDGVPDERLVVSREWSKCSADCLNLSCKRVAHRRLSQRGVQASHTQPTVLTRCARASHTADCLTRRAWCFDRRWRTRSTGPRPARPWSRLARLVKARTRVVKVLRRLSSTGMVNLIGRLSSTSCPTLRRLSSICRLSDANRYGGESLSLCTCIYVKISISIHSHR